MTVSRSSAALQEKAHPDVAAPPKVRVRCAGDSTNLIGVADIGNTASATEMVEHVAHWPFFSACRWR